MKVTQNNKYYLAASVSLLTFAVYLFSLHHEFVEWDDSMYVFENPHIRSFDMSFLKWAFTGFHAGNWHPLTWISHAVDYAIWGLNPLGHHLTNIVLHSVNTFAVVFLVIGLIRAVRERTSGDESWLDEKMMLITAGVTGLLFGLHPLHVESVAWVAERKDLLCALFYMLSLMAYTKYAQADSDETRGKEATLLFSDKRYLYSLGFFMLALLSKPMAVSLPAVLVILDWYPFGRIQSLKSFWKSVINKLPFIALSLGSSVLTILAQRAGGAMVSMELAPLSTRLLVAGKSLVIYLWKMIWPLNLSPFYPYPQDISLALPEYYLPLFLVLGISLTCLVIAKRQRIWLAAWGYYVATLIPVIGIVQIGNTAMADRYSYLPSIGPFLIVGLLAALLLKAMNALKQRKPAVLLIYSSLAVLVLGSLSYLTCNQIGVWKNSIVLWGYVIEREPDAVPLAYYNRGLVYLKKGQFGPAMADFNKAIVLDPSDYRAYNNLGVIYGQLGQFDSAIECFNITLYLNQSFDMAYVNRGSSYEKIGNRERAVLDYQKACDLGNTNGCKALQRAVSNSLPRGTF